LIAELELALDAVAAPEYEGKPLAGPPIGRVKPVFVALDFQKKRKIVINSSNLKRNLLFSD